MPIEINSSRFTSKAWEVLKWARVYALSGGAGRIESDDVFRGLLSIRLTVAFSVLEVRHVVDRLRSSLGLVSWHIGSHDCNVVETDLSDTMRVLMELVEQEAQASGRQKIDTGHLLKVLANHVPAVTAAINKVTCDERAVQTIIRLANDIAPRHKELADTDDLQTPVSPAAQQMVVLPPKPQREDEPVRVEPVERAVTPEAFAGLLLDLSRTYPMGFETFELRTMLVAALESYDPRALDLKMGQMISVVRLLGWRRSGEFANLIRRLAKPSISVDMVQDRYDEIRVGDDANEECELFGILLQLLTGQPVRRRGPAIDWLKTEGQ